MADQKLSELAEAVSVSAADLLYLVQTATSKKLPFSTLEAAIDHANIVAGDGSDHGDVASNTTHRGLTSGNPHSVSKSDVSLGNVTDNAQYYAGGTDVAIADGGTGQGTAQAAIDALTQVSGATNEHVLTKDTGTGNAIFKAPAGGSDVKVGVDSGATADYLGAAAGDGVFRVDSTLDYTDGGNFITLGLDSTLKSNYDTGYNHSQDNSQAHTDYMLNTGDIVTGDYDFGGADSLEIPNAAGGKTINAAGEVCVDTTSKTLNFHDGTEEVAVNPIQCETFHIENPVAADDWGLSPLDKSITVVKIIYSISGGTNWVGQVQEADDIAGTNASNLAAADSTVTGETTVTSFSDSALASGDWLYLKTTSVSGAVDRLVIKVFYKDTP